MLFPEEANRTEEVNAAHYSRQQLRRLYKSTADTKMLDKQQSGAT
jgi:hypothetical protein